MKAITYHKATLSDIETLVEYRIRFATELIGEQDPEAVTALKKQMTGYFLTAIPENKCISFIGTCDGTVAGMGSLQVREQPGNFKNPSGKWGYIMSMYTVPEFRRRGVCQAILNELVADAANYGITAFELHATPAGELVYKQSGFEIHNEPTYRKFIKPNE